MPPSDKKADAKQRRRKHGKQPTQHDPRGHPVMLVGPTGKRRMVWSSEQDPR